MSDRLRRRARPWERRRPAGIFSAFQALFFFVVCSNHSLENSSARGETRLDEATEAKRDAPEL